MVSLFFYLENNIILQFIDWAFLRSIVVIINLNHFFMKKLLLFSFALMLLVSCTKEIEMQDSAPLTKSGKQTLALTFFTNTYYPPLIPNYGLQFHCSTPDVWKIDLNVHNVWMCWNPSDAPSPIFTMDGIGVQLLLNSDSDMVPCAIDYRSFVDLGSIRVNDASVAATAAQYDFNVVGIPAVYYGENLPGDSIDIHPGVDEPDSLRRF